MKEVPWQDFYPQTTRVVKRIGAAHTGAMVPMTRAEIRWQQYRRECDLKEKTCQREGSRVEKAKDNT